MKNKSHGRNKSSVASRAKVLRKLVAVTAPMRVSLFVRVIGRSVRVIAGVPSCTGIFRSMLEAARRTVVIAVAC